MADERNPYIPEERYVILYWDADTRDWTIGVEQSVSQTRVREAADLYRIELGHRRVRVVHTADGTPR